MEIKSSLFKEIEENCCFKEGNRVIRRYSEKEINYLFQAIDKFSRIKNLMEKEYVLVKNGVPFDIARKILDIKNRKLVAPNTPEKKSYIKGKSFTNLPDPTSGFINIRRIFLLSQAIL